MSPENVCLLRQGLAALGLDAATAEPLARYQDRLADGNRRLNLTGLADERDSVIKNLLDSVAPWRQLDDSLPILDVGTGAGLPGIPLALVRPDFRVALVESKAKKARFLEDTVAALGLSARVTIVHRDAWTLEPAAAQLLIRAYGTLAKIRRLARRVLEPPGRVMAYKGQRSRVDAELADAGLAERAVVHAVTVPGLDAGEQRHVVIWSVG